MSRSRKTARQKTQESGFSFNGRCGRKDPTPQAKLLTCETWVTKPEWYAYAKQHREQVPPDFLLVDRSPCMDPFLDPYAPSEEERRPFISGLCRFLTNVVRGDIFIYLTKVDPDLYNDLKILNKATSYLGIAALTVAKIYESHEKAAETFEPRRYVVDPASTPYPPNLAYDPEMPAAVGPKSCIVWLDKVPYTPDDFDEDKWRAHSKEYYQRQVDKRLCAAECCLLQVANGRKALQLDPMHAPVFIAADWGKPRMYQAGYILEDAEKVDWFCQQIANGR
jgi:hypothetical protein